MLFTEPRFLAFFAIVFAVYWLLPWRRARNLWLLAGSYVFYGAWDWRFLSLILTATAVGYVAAEMMEQSDSSRARRLHLVVSLIVNLGILGTFKYFDFFVVNGAEFLTWLGLPTGIPTLRIVLPVGISFFTFQTVGYTIDVYMRRIEAARDPFDFALFVAFFPQLVAGPIVRASTLLPQLAQRRPWSAVDVRGCLVLLLFGFVKKACISDHISAVIDPVFANPASYTAVSIQLASFYYAVQIYCDFSGYTDMAIACAGLLGYTLPPNFRFPYLAANVAEFWRRWHISLSTWLRDYLYIPLGGSSGSRAAVFNHLMITMLLGGLWHGAGGNFVFWGGMHGLALAAHRYWRRGADAQKKPHLLARGLGTLATFYWVTLMWTLFRADNLGEGLLLCWSFVSWQSFGSKMIPENLWWGLLALATVHILAAALPMKRSIAALPDWLFFVALGATTAVAFSFVSTSYEPFIYFQF